MHQALSCGPGRMLSKCLTSSCFIFLCPGEQEHLTSFQFGAHSGEEGPITYLYRGAASYLFRVSQLSRKGPRIYTTEPEVCASNHFQILPLVSVLNHFKSLLLVRVH
jgi:hypothetical protein